MFLIKNHALHYSLYIQTIHLYLRKLQTPFNGNSNYKEKVTQIIFAILKDCKYDCHTHPCLAPDDVEFPSIHAREHRRGR